MKASKIFLLLGILGVGGSVETAWQVRNHFGVGPMGWVVLGGKFRGPHFDYEASETREVPAGAVVEIENAFGSVDVKAGEPGKVTVSVRKVVYLPMEEKARELAARLKIQASLEGNRLRVTTNRQELDGSGQIHFGWDDSVAFETHFTVSVPPDTEVTVKNSHGRVDLVDVAAARIETSYDDVRLERVKGSSNVTLRHGNFEASELAGDAELSIRYGDVKLTDVARTKISQAHGDVAATRTGPLNVEVEYGDVTAETVKGAFEVRGQHAAVRASDVAGDADVTTSFDDITFTNVGGDVRAKAEHGGVKCNDVRGAVVVESSFNETRLDSVAGAVEATVSHGGFHGQGLGAAVRVRTEGDEIVIDGFRGTVVAEAKRGGVRLVPGGPLMQSVTASASFGDVRLEVPEGSRFDVTAAADQGDVSVTLPDFVASESGKRRIAGKVGAGGALVQLQTSHGDVAVSQSGSLAASR